MKKGLILMTVVPVCSLLFGLNAMFAQEGQADHDKLFNDKCSQCHSLKRVEKRRMSAQDWEKTVQSMKKKKKSNITDEDAKVIVTYLAGRYGK